MLRVCLYLTSAQQYFERILQSFIISFFSFGFPVRTIKLCSRRNVDGFCHKQQSLIRGAASSVFRDQQTPPLSARPITYTPPSNVDDARRSSSHRSQSQILVENREFCPMQFGGPRQNIAITFGTENLEWVAIPDSEKF